MHVYARVCARVCVVISVCVCTKIYTLSLSITLVTDVCYVSWDKCLFYIFNVREMSMVHDHSIIQLWYYYASLVQLSGFVFFFFFNAYQ